MISRRGVGDYSLWCGFGGFGGRAEWLTDGWVVSSLISGGCELGRYHVVGWGVLSRCLMGDRDGGMET